MKYRIIGDTMPAVEVMFDVPGECMYTQSGGMAWMSDGIEMATNTRGGFMKGLPVSLCLWQPTGLSGLGQPLPLHLPLQEGFYLWM